MRDIHILLLENDLGLAESLSHLFKSQNWRVTQVGTLGAAKKVVIKQAFNLAIIDRILEDGDGLEFIEHLQFLADPMMRLCLTSKGEVMDRLKGLGAGADDYLPKPFATQELLFRINNLLNKERKQDKPQILHDQLIFNPATGEIQTPVAKLHLRRRENQILSCLLRHRRTIVTRQMLMDTLWPSSDYFPDTATLDVYVRRLRSSLGTYGSLIKTVRGYGYLLQDTLT